MLNNWNNINNNPHFGSMTANFGMSAPQSGNSNVSAPSMEAQINQQALSEAASDNFIGNRINAYSEVNPLLQLGLSLPVAMAINIGMDKYLKLYDGEYSKSLPGKIGNFGDKVSDFFADSPVGKLFESAKKKAAPVWKKYVYDKSGLVRAFDKTPTRPEFVLVQQQMEQAIEMPMKDYFNAAEEFFKPLNSAKDLDSIGAGADDIKRIEQRIAANPAKKAEILLEEQFKILKPSATAKEIADFAASTTKEDVIKELKLKALGWKDMAEFDAAKKAPVQSRAKVLEKLKNMKNKNLFARIDWSDASNLSKAKGFAMGRKMPFERIYNIIMSSAGNANTMQKTALGRQLAKIVNLVTEGATGRMFGGKLSTIMQAFFVAEALIMASRQETTGDKLKSFAERMTELIGFFVFIGPSIKLMHKIGGLKFSGMTPEQVKAYEKAVVEFNDKVAKGFFKNETAYNMGKLKLQMQYRPKSKNPITWIGRKIGDFVSTGLKTTIRPYSKHAHKEVDLNVFKLFEHPKEFLKELPKNLMYRMADVAHNPKYWFKRFAGWPIRFAIPMMLILPFFNKIAVKGCHAVVGKPKYSLLDQDKYEQEQEKAQELEQQKAMLDAIKAQQQQQQGNTTGAASIPEIKPKNDGSSDTNLIRNAAQSQNEVNSQTTTQTTTQTRTETVNQNNNNSTEPVRTYIPNPAGLVVQNPDTSGLDKAFAQADKTEQEIQNILKMN